MPARQCDEYGASLAAMATLVRRAPASMWAAIHTRMPAPMPDAMPIRSRVNGGTAGRTIACRDQVTGGRRRHR
ncbi:hypothetical protein DIE06_30405 [Burkholderia sp. Bp8998]|nr:hypothetical protein DIE06_30405 [Burkholderia sp. Bp8998]